MLSENEPDTYFEAHTAFETEPVQLAERLARACGTGPYLLYERDGEFCFAGGARAQLRISPSRVRLDLGGHGYELPLPHDPLDAVALFGRRLPLTGWRMYGWAAFELALLLAGRESGEPEADLLHLFVPRSEVRFARGRALIRATDRPTIAALTATITASQPAGHTCPPTVAVRVQDAGNYRAAVAEAVARIRAGALEKVIISRVVPVPGEVDLIATYRYGRPAHTPARSFLLNAGRMRAVGFCPETVIEVEADGTVRAQPLAGTRARGSSPEVTGRLGEELRSDPKEVYEHAVSVRAVWQEIARLPGCTDVRAERFMSLVERGSVQHLASELRGRLPGGGLAQSWSAFAALFPSVTATGIPKPAAYEVIRDLEQGARGLYGGAVLTCDEDGALDAALVLRAAYQDESGTWLRAGAGIVGQSNPEREHEETCEKLRGVANVLVAPNTLER